MQSRLQKRFLMLALPGLAVVLAGVGVGFLASSGTVTTSIIAAGASASTYVYPMATSAAVPTAVTFVKYGTVTSAALSAYTAPNWSPKLTSAGTVTTAGGLAVINASASTLIVDMYVTNLAGLGKDYGSYAFPIQVWKATTPTSTANWTKTTTKNPAQYLTSSSGYLAFHFTTGAYYEVTITTGGSFFCQSTSAGTLGPKLYFAARPV